jgi:hypothetical protein
MSMTYFGDESFSRVTTPVYELLTQNASSGRRLSSVNPSHVTVALHFRGSVLAYSVSL